MRPPLALAVVLLALAHPAAAPAATITSSPATGGRVVYEAGPGEANDVTVRRAGDEIRVSDAGASIQAFGDCRADGDAAVCPGAGAVSALVDLGDRDDRVEWLIGFPEVRGGPGDDRIRAAGPVDGGPGADAMEAQSVGYGTRTAGVEVTPDGLANDGEPGEGDNVTGVRYITGGGGPDVLSAAGAGSEVSLIGNSGADRLIGGEVDDGLFGGPGEDFLDGGPGIDHLDGGAGPDELHGGGRADGDHVIGGPGSDRVAVGSRAQLVMRDGEADEISCTRPGAIHLDLDAFDRAPWCTYAYLEFRRVARVYTSSEGTVRVRATCFSSLNRPCHGAVRLLLAGTRTVLAKGAFHLQHEETDAVELELRPAGRRLRRTRRRAAVEAVAAHEVPSAPPATSGLDTRRATWVTRR